MNRFVIAEPDKCIGCRTCEVACVLAHRDGMQDGVALSAENFHPRLRLVKNLTLTAPVQCRQCENAPCVNVCPTGALVYDRNTVQIRRERCIGCQSCVIACPFGAMEMVNAPVRQPDLGPLHVQQAVSVAQKCDLCIETETGPACMAVCPTHALHLVDTEAIDNKTRRKREKSAFAMPADAFR
ncbi:MAG: 4Fe-4S dicluster domain-containing protein [Oxalobacter formigenes]|nr:4Fe-4S dicluster domain-containing protein [Oxalobacter formigenes]